MKNADPAPRVRQHLAQAGFDVHDWDDRQLATLEYTARLLATGVRVFVPAPMEPLVNTLVQVHRNPR